MQSSVLSPPRVLNKFIIDQILLKRNLYLGEPIFYRIAIPDPMDIAEARIVGNLKIVIFKIFEYYSH